jgi:hypothetical protein
MANHGKFNGRVRVAIVDDEDGTRKLLRDILGSTENFKFAGEFLAAFSKKESGRKGFQNGARCD